MTKLEAAKTAIMTFIGEQEDLWSSKKQDVSYENDPDKWWGCKAKWILFRDAKKIIQQIEINNEKGYVIFGNTIKSAMINYKYWGAMENWPYYVHYRALQYVIKAVFEYLDSITDDNIEALIDIYNQQEVRNIPVANKGEIALRNIRLLRKLAGINENDKKLK